MLEKTVDFFKNRRSAFSFELLICRLIAAWCGFAAITLFAADGDFSALEFAQNVSFFKAAFSVLAFFAAYTFINLLLNAFETDSWLLLLASTVCVGRWLSVYSVIEREFLFTLAVIAAYSLFVVYCVRKNDTLLQKWQPNKATVWSFAIAAGLICGGVIGAVTCYRYLSFSAPNFDFGLFVNMFHNMKETGLPMVTSERDVLMSHFAVHISPIYYLLLPFYCIFPSPLTLQIGQAVVLASGIVPVVLLCRQLKVSGKATLLVTLIYALYPAMSAGCFYDIHENCFLTPLLRERKVPPYVSFRIPHTLRQGGCGYIRYTFCAVLDTVQKKASPRLDTYADLHSLFRNGAGHSSARRKLLCRALCGRISQPRHKRSYDKPLQQSYI